MAQPIRLVIDTDAGVDDSLAIALALQHPSCHVEAITCCHGNTKLENVTGNVLRVLKVFGRTDIPVYSGCDRSLVGEQKDALFHGNDGFGNIAHTISVSELALRSEHSSVALVEYAKRYKGELTLAAIGPLTNLALAQRIDPSFSSNLKQLVIMGGNVDAFGNATMASEFNFDCDPEAAKVVLEEFECPKLCIPWETCHASNILWKNFEALIALDNDHARFVRAITAHSVQQLQEHSRIGYRSCDLFALACFFEPKVAETTQKLYATVELRGLHTRGQMVVEKRLWRQDAEKPNLDIVMKINDAALLEVCKLIFR